MDKNKDLGKRIKELRKSKGFTQERLSEIVGVDPKHLSRIECGKNVPSIDLITRISSVLGIELQMFFQTSHLKSKDSLIKEINKILDNETEEKVRLYYKILMDISV
ncbi:TPA: helix-turn-helix transcriptional regulator [Candidatus Spyradomonas excrementavium]|nr:helix-turn-helix transcriptional regulator [Candidatus Spyradomonas excrementavium]